MNENMDNWKSIIGALLGALIAIVWIAYALINPGSMVFLVVAIGATILLGTLSGGLYGLAAKERKEKNQ